MAAVDSPARLTAHVNAAATVRWMEGGELHVEETDHPTELIRQRSTDGAELAQLTVTRPTLEDAYLHLDRAGVMAIESAENASTPRHRADDSGSALPSAVRIGLSRVVPELKMFYRRPEQLVLTFSMPAVICLLLGSIFSAKLPGTETSTGAVIAASMLAYGILSTSFINLGIGIAADRETGALRRLRGTPATASSYFIGKIMLVAIASLAEAIILLLVGRAGLSTPIYPPTCSDGSR